MQLQSIGNFEQYTAARAALETIAPDHRSRSLVERLILDKEIWIMIYDKWQPLVKEEATWEDLAEVQLTDGRNAVVDKLCTEYGLPQDAASAVTSLVARRSSEARVAGALFVTFIIYFCSQSWFVQSICRLRSTTTIHC